MPDTRRHQSQHEYPSASVSDETIQLGRRQQPCALDVRLTAIACHVATEPTNFSAQLVGYQPCRYWAIIGEALVLPEHEHELAQALHPRECARAGVD